MATGLRKMYERQSRRVKTQNNLHCDFFMYEQVAYTTTCNTQERGTRETGDISEDDVRGYIAQHVRVDAED